MASKSDILAHRQLLSGSFMQFVTKMFQFTQGTPYIVGQHHRLIASALEEVIKGRYTKLIINIAPRYGKTCLVSQMFPAYGFALNPKCKFIHLSYSGGLVTDNSVAVKDIMNSEYYRMLFDARIRRGSDQKAKWETEQGGGLYATTTLGQITGFGAGATDKEDEDDATVMDEFTADGGSLFSGAVVIDDPIKPEDALSDVIRERVNRRFETTIRNRVNSRRTPIIVIMQRLHAHDLCGYLQEIEPDEWKVVSIPCLTIDEQGNEHALWEHKHTVEELHKIQLANSFVFETQYQQNPMPLEGLMYSEFKTYSALPEGGEDKCCCDPADTGRDFLCSIFYREYKGCCYVTDVMYTQDDMDVTEPMMAQKLYANHTTECAIEANGAGRLYAKNVERRCREQGNAFTRIDTFTQTQNKAIRIYSNANAVNNVVYMPVGWERRWPAYCLAMTTFLKEGRNAHDDGPDCTTSMIERMGMTSQNKDLTGFFF